VFNNWEVALILQQKTLSGEWDGVGCFSFCLNWVKRLRRSKGLIVTAKKTLGICKFGISENKLRDG